MPHRCMNCGKEYDDDAEELIEGCECGSNLFLYKKGSRDMDKEELKEEKNSVMKELDDFLKDVKGKVSPDSEPEFHLESIKVKEDGVYEINLKKLLEEIPLIVEIKEGSYRLHLPSAFSKGEKKGLRLKDLELGEELEEGIELDRK